MIRVYDLEKALDFFCNKLGLIELRRKENAAGEFTLIFLATAVGEPEIELTYNWNNDLEYSQGRNFGHLAYEVSNIYDFCNNLIEKGVTINRPPRDGRMAFIKSPDGISVELLQKGEALEVKELWKSMENTDTW